MTITGPDDFITPHFKWSECWTTDNRQYLAENRNQATGFLPTLTQTALLMEDVRALFGAPIVVHSMYRCPALNTHIGGSPSSQHMKGEACDFHVVGTDLKIAFERIRQSPLKWGQLLLEGHTGGDHYTWIHVSLGAPWRPARECQQVALVQGSHFEWMT